MKRIGAGALTGQHGPAAYRQSFTQSGQNGTNLLDAQGADLLPSLHGLSFAVGSETGGLALQTVVDGAIGAEGPGKRQLSYVFGQGRSDYANFVSAGVPTVFFSHSTGACYHTTGDDTALVDFRKLRTESRIAFRTAVMLAETATSPSFVPPNPALAVYADAVALNEVLGLTDLALFDLQSQGLLARRDQVRAVVAAGPAQFDANAIDTILPSAIDALGALGRLPCRKM